MQQNQVSYKWKGNTNEHLSQASSSQPESRQSDKNLQQYPKIKGNHRPANLKVFTKLVQKNSDPNSDVTLKTEQKNIIKLEQVDLITPKKKMVTQDEHDPYELTEDSKKHEEHSPFTPFKKADHAIHHQSDNTEESPLKININNTKKNKKQN